MAAKEFKDVPSFARRRLVTLIGALWAGASAIPGFGQVLGKVPGKLPSGRSVYEARGDCRVNGRTASAETAIRAGDTIETGAKAQIIFAVGADAFLVREDSRVVLAGEDLVISGLRLVTGAILAVFGGPAHAVETPFAILGTRGTGIYVEVRPDRVYACNCYGTVEISARGTEERETIVSKHHDGPRYILAQGEKRIVLAPLVNHTDQELALIEALVGRTPPFALFDSGYGSQKRY